MWFTSTMLPNFFSPFHPAYSFFLNGLCRGLLGLMVFWAPALFAGASNAIGTSTPQSMTIQSPAPVVTPNQKFTGFEGTALNCQLLASNSPTGYALASGALPTGLTLNTATGVISGTPTVRSTFTLAITASNAAGTSAPETISIQIKARLKMPQIFSDRMILQREIPVQVWGWTEPGDSDQQTEHSR